MKRSKQRKVLLLRIFLAKLDVSKREVVIKQTDFWGIYGSFCILDDQNCKNGVDCVGTFDV